MPRGVPRRARSVPTAAQTAEALASAPMRPAPRAPLREEDPRARAAARAAELRDHLGTMDEGEDKFFVDQADIPDGWDYEWKRETVLGKEDPAYQVQVARMGWEPVPASRHPSYMPADGKHVVIRRDGMVLMERPKEITEEARRIELKKARQQVRTKEEQLNAAPAGHFERQNKDAPLARIKKSYEAMPIPE